MSNIILICLALVGAQLGQFHKMKQFINQPLSMLDQILHIQKITCHSTKKIMEGIFQFCLRYQVMAPLVLPYITIGKL